MAVRGFFYNSVNKDRLYNGQDMNEDKAPFYKEGVAYGHLQVTADGESMAVKVDGGSRTGYAYAEMTQAFMTDQEAQWNKWFKEKQTELSGDIAGKLQLQIDDVKEKVYNIAFKVYIISTLEQITSPVTVKLTNKTTGTMQTVTVTKSQMGFYVTEAGEYTVEADLESVMVTPKAFKVTNDNLMTTQNITLREGSNMGYIGNYIGSFIAQ